MKYEVTCWLRAAAVAALPILSSCATITFGEPRVSTHPIKQTQETGVSDVAAFEVQQDGTELTVRANHLCGTQIVRHEIVRTERERVNSTPGADWVLAGTGTTLLAFGGVMLVDASHVHGTNTSSREYNPYGPKTALAIGGASAAVGAGLVTLAIVDIVRAQGAESTERVRTEVGPFTNLKPCGMVPYAGVSVSVSGFGWARDVGTTGADGSVTIDLAAVFGSDEVRSEPQSKGKVLAFGKQVAEWDPMPVFGHQDEAKWKSSDRSGCAQPTRSSACDSVRAYVTRFPEGTHTKEARALLDAAEPELARLRDDEAWAKVDRAGCVVAAVVEACATVEGYLGENPNGRHATEARELLRHAAPKIANLRREREENIRRLAEAKSIVEVSAVAVELESDQRGYYLGVEFDATLKKRVPRFSTPMVKASCLVGKKRMVDETGDISALNGLNTGETVRVSLGPFILAPLRAEPSRCDLFFYLKYGLGQDAMPLGYRCFGTCN